MGQRFATARWLLLSLPALMLLSGCHSVLQPPTGAPDIVLPAQPAVRAPSEMEKTSLPMYVIEPPDILLIDAIKVVPKPPYRLQPLDVLQILVTGTPTGEEIAGTYALDEMGDVQLGPTYGKVRLIDLTEDEALERVTEKLLESLNEPEVSLTLIASAGQEQIVGEHLVGPDGTVNLGTYGRVYVAGLTLREAKQAIEAQLSKQLDDPKVAMDVFAFNSKVYYIILEGSGYGDSISRVPVTGNETVLDALAQVNGLSRLSTKHIWIARPAPSGVGCDQILPIKWDEIVKGGGTATNYQVLPGDRIFVSGSKLALLDSTIAKIIAPAERVFGFGLLGGQTIQTFNRFPKGGNQSFF
jgi:protein involved in polysaccharide export with SLBB domain